MNLPAFRLLNLLGIPPHSLQHFQVANLLLYRVARRLLYHQETQQTVQVANHLMNLLVSHHRLLLVNPVVLQLVSHRIYQLENLQEILQLSHHQLQLVSQVLYLLANHLISRPVSQLKILQVNLAINQVEYLHYVQVVNQHLHQLVYHLQHHHRNHP